MKDKYSRIIVSCASFLLLFAIAIGISNNATDTYAAGVVGITLNPNGGEFQDGTTAEKTISVVSGTTIESNITDPTKSNYTFKGWYTAQTGGTKVLEISENGGTFWAQWDRITYTITYDTQGGSTVNKQTKYAGENITITAVIPTKENCSFANWNTKSDGTGVIYETGATYNKDENITLYAKWVCPYEETLRITFNPNGGTVSPTTMNVTIGGTYPTLPTPIKSGYSFLGWYTASSVGSKITAGMAVQNVTTLYAHWELNEITEVVITFYPNGGTFSGDTGVSNPKTKTYSKGAQYGDEPIISKSGCTFAGWNTKSDGSGTTINAGEPVDFSKSTYSLTAQWRNCPTSGTSQTSRTSSTSPTSPTQKYTITYNSQGGSAVSSQTGEVGKNIVITSTKPQKSGYTFAGWNTKSDGTGDSYIGGSTYSKGVNVTLYAQWVEGEKTTYTITYDANGGSGTPSPQTKVQGTPITLSTKAPTRTGYDFAGWSTNKNATSGTYDKGATFTIDADTVLYAIWEENTKTKSNYTVTYYMNDGTEEVYKTETVSNGSKATKPTDPTRLFYVFVGWYTDENTTTKYDFNTTIDKNINLYAKWKLITEDYDPSEDLPSASDVTPTDDNVVKNPKTGQILFFTVSTIGIMSLGVVAYLKKKQKI